MQTFQMFIEGLLIFTVSGIILLLGAWRVSDVWLNKNAGWLVPLTFVILFSIEVALAVEIERLTV